MCRICRRRRGWSGVDWERTFVVECVVMIWRFEMFEVVRMRCMRRRRDRMIFVY